MNLIGNHSFKAGMKHKLIILIVAVALSSCAAPAPTLSPTTHPPSATLTQPPTRSPTPELTATPSYSVTPLPSATFVPTLLPTAINTEIAPEDVGVCPTENSDLKPDFSLDILANESVPRVLEPSLDFLNRGGSPDALGVYLGQSHIRFYKGDLTGDGIPEISVNSTLKYDVIGCIGGEYVVLLTFTDFPRPAFPEVYEIKDMNLNGILDVVFFTPVTCGFHACYQTSVLEWHPTGFKFISKSSWQFHSTFLSMAGPYKLEIKDIDSNGTFELILDGGIPFWDDYRDGLPWRVQTDTYMWDGEAYSLYRTELGPPEHRFQAIQDGDEAMRWNEYDKALAFYQQAIFDEKLKAWSLEQREYEWAIWDARFDPETPTPAPTPALDPAEYPNLAAYARYRIMLLHLQHGYESDAKIVYDTLQQKFPDGQAGHTYAELAATFWSDYQTNHDLKQACTKAIEFAASHKVAVLAYLGNIAGGGYEYYYHGWQSHDYAPEDICSSQ